MPGLYIVATPIGNMADLTRRAAEWLCAADLVLVEDSRVTGKLLKKIGSTARMRVYNDHSDEQARVQILELAREQAVALVSDAGTPLISDPGYKLVRAAREAGIAVTAAPGPSAGVAALTLSGLPSDRFLFLGFLPSKEKARRDALSEAVAVDATLIAYESPARLGRMLADAVAMLGKREAAVAREISKLHEEVVTGSLTELAQRYANSTPKGEIVVVIGPPQAETASQAEIEAALRDALADHSASQAAKLVANRFDTDRKALYALTQAWKEEER